MTPSFRDCLGAIAAALLAIPLALALIYLSFALCVVAGLRQWPG